MNYFRTIDDGVRNLDHAFLTTLPQFSPHAIRTGLYRFSLSFLRVLISTRFCSCTCTFLASYPLLLVNIIRTSILSSVTVYFRIKQSWSVQQSRFIWLTRRRILKLLCLCTKVPYFSSCFLKMALAYIALLDCILSQHVKQFDCFRLAVKAHRPSCLSFVLSIVGLHCTHPCIYIVFLSYLRTALARILGVIQLLKVVQKSVHDNAER